MNAEDAEYSRGAHAAPDDEPWPTQQSQPAQPAPPVTLASVAASTPVPLGAGVSDAVNRIAANIEQVIEGKHGAIRLGIAVLLAEGHLLIEDVPGVGKTKFAKALARSIDCSVRRMQFTPDLLPSDVTGVSVYNTEDRDFEFKPGPVFANIVVGDEINRASPKTQAALLECMEERQVTVDGITYALEAPFMVLATQNPVDMEGTYPLPEAQRDRFTARISMGYPDRAAEIAMLNEHASVDPLDSLRPVSDATEVRALIAAVRTVHVADAVKAYAVDLAEATRRVAEIRLGASPRATLQLLRAAKAWAAIDGREYVIPDDVQQLLVPVLSHRLLLTSDAHVGGRTAQDLLTRVIRSTPIPGEGLTPAAGAR
ncbi:MAG TPA: MoxR family ATPase [Jatrophihabitantaceae bacterium]|nr:MoxR family ATPase [Jatrophihabitantaceae bacterium]